MIFLFVSTYLLFYAHLFYFRCYRISINCVSMLPTIRSSIKYNQANTRIYEKYFPQLSIRQYTPQLNEYSITADQSVEKKHKKYSFVESSMKKLKKKYVNSEREKEKENQIDELDKAKEKQKIASKKSIKRIVNGEVIDRKKSTSDIYLSTRRLNTKQKPPHRYKTTMLIFKHCLLLYGGLGCEKNLTWARLTFQSMTWQINHESTEIKMINSYSPCSPIYGHTLCQYKDIAIVYGGSCNDEINETTIINTRTMEVTQGSICPYRRKQHAALVIGEFMFVHGGIQSRQTKNDMFMYNIQLDKWMGMFNNSSLPALSSHKMVKGKNSKEIYLFGGLNSKSKSVNKLYRLKIMSIQNLEVRVQQIQCLNPPMPRHSFCMQKISVNHIVLYGGRQDNQTDNEDQGIQKGVFNDVHVYNIDKKTWKRTLLNSDFGYCFGMASTSLNGAVFIFGGSNHSLYADASINMIWNSEQKADPWECVQSSDRQIYSSKRISTKFIHI